MKGLFAVFALVAGFFFTGPAHAGFQGIDHTGKSLGIFDTIACIDGTECSRLKGKFQMKVSGIQDTTVSGATDALTDDACGKSFKNSAAAVVTLPAAVAANVGCKITFLVGHASNYDINPNGTDQIMILTNAAGDAIRNATVGGTVTLQILAAGQWASLGVSGTWTDIN